MKTKSALRITLGVLGVFLLFYFGYQVYMFVSPSYKTEIALLVTVSDSVDAKGIVARDETVVDIPDSAIAAYCAEDGEKIASGAAVADVYADAGAALRAFERQRLAQTAAALSRAADTGRTSGSNIDNLRSRIYKELSALSGELTVGGYDSAFYGSLGLLELLASYNTAAGVEVDYAPALARVNASLAALGEGDNITSTVYTPAEGYFISGLDGYETLLDSETLLDAPADDVLGVLEADAPPKPNGGCKVVSGYEWYFVCALSSETAARMSVGDELSVDFSYSLSDALPMTVARAEALSDGARTLVALNCDRLDASLCRLRVESARISFKSYTGLKVSRSSLRLLDGELGVYIKYGSTVRFRRVNVIYETDEFIISKPDSSDSGVLAVYDEIIVEGRDISEGKQLGRVNII